MKIVSWNVNGLRACIKKGFCDFVAKEGADFFCIQETKMEQEQLGFTFQGYFEYWHSSKKKGHSGVVVFAKHKAINVTYGIGDEFCDEGRIITLEYEKFFLVNCYSPHAQRNLNHLSYKQKFDYALIEYLEHLKKQKSVILCGDLNVAHKDIDLRNYKSNKGNAGFTKQERADFDSILAKGFIDSFRFIYPNKDGAYTWWPYRKGVRERNIGWRIDYVLLSENIKEYLIDSTIHADVYGSDHCPIGIVLNIYNYSI